MRKAGAKEGSIGSKGAIDRNQVPVSVAVTGRRSDLMNKFCSCTGRSSSSSLTCISMTCKGCSGESTSGKGGPSCNNKLNSMGLELPRPLDLEVRWKNVYKRQRARRRARTSFFGEDRIKDDLRSFYAFGNAMNRGMSQEDAPESSDSEKLGVSILGGRFSDPMGNIPIKKRRFHVDCSPSPPPTPLLVDPYEKISRSCSWGVPSYDKCREEQNGFYDAGDFSGISILAAAACDSEIGGEILNGPCLKLAHPLEEMKLENTIGSNESHPLEERKLENTTGGAESSHPLEERKLENTMGDTESSRPFEETKLENTMSSTELGLLHGMKEDKLNLLEASHCTYDRPFEPSNSASDMKPLFATTLTGTNLDESASAPKDNWSFHSALSSADKTKISSDSKSSSVAVLYDASNSDKSIDCSQNAAAKSKHSKVTRDSRLHWDLNVAMEAWDTDCGDDDDRGGPTAVLVGDSNDGECDMNEPQLPHVLDSTDAGDAPGLLVDQSHIVDAPKDVMSVDEGDPPADTLSHPLQDQSLQNFEILKAESVGKDASAETLELPDQQNSLFASAVESHVGSNPECSLISEHLATTSNVEKNDGSHPIPVGCKGLSHMSSVNDHVGVNSIQTCELDSTGKPLANRLVSEESTNFPAVTAFHKRIMDVDWSDNKLEEASEQSISELKNQDLLDDSGTSKVHQLAGRKGEHGADVLCIPKSSARTESLTHPEDNPGSSVCDMARVHEVDGADAVMNSRDCLITCASSSSAETYYISGAVQAPALSSECNKPAVTDAENIMESQAATTSYQNTHENELGKVASDICFEHRYETSASHYSKSVARIGKLDTEEDDSQYEDGEVRESGDWTDDAYGGQCGNWHYQTSDYKNEVIAHDMPPLPIDSASKNVGIHIDGYNRTETRKKDDIVAPAFSKRLWSTNCLDSGSVSSGKAQDIYSRVPGETQMHDINQGHVTVGSAATVNDIECCNDDLGDNLPSIRTKNTGWDMFPEDQMQSLRGSKDRADSSNLRISSSIDGTGGDDSLRKVGQPNRDVQRIERPRPFEISHSNELSRSADGYSSGTKTEMAIDSRRSTSGYDGLHHIQAGSQGDQWVENSKHPRSSRHKSPECYNYGPAGPRNAAEAAVAKMESNGFVVARDGTLVKVVDDASAVQMSRRMRNTLSSSYRPLAGRGSPIERNGTYGLSRGPAHAREASPEHHFGVTSNRSGRYGPDMEKDHTSNGNLSSVRCLLPSRQRGVPAGRASLNLSRPHSRSPSGSRSRSPHDWASPSNRRKIIANGGSTLRRPSRSPNRVAKIRMGRMTSPQRQPGYDDRAVRYSPPPRNQDYSHPSTWVDGRNSSAVDLSDHTKRYSRRSPLRITSRNHRFDVMDSQSRSRTGELYRPTQGRLPYGYDRGKKHDGNGDDRREYTNRYQSHSVKPYDRDGAVKQFRNNTGDKFQTRISAPRSPELQRRASPRRFGRSFER